MARPRRSSQLRRRRSTRERYDRVLIVCEGSKSEPTYFRDMARHLGLSTANAVVVGSGADPRWLVTKAKELAVQERRLGEQYDEVYCVFDHDEHVHFSTASSIARDVGIMLARSWPCFEYWLVAHFVYHRRPYGRSRTGTAAQNCVRELRRYLPDYSKGIAGLYGVLEDRLEAAKSNAERALADAEDTGSPNPSTGVHRLVAYLQALKSGAG